MDKRSDKKRRYANLDESQANAKRQNINLKERDRQSIISEAFNDLGELLEASGLKLERKSRLSILRGAREYILELKRLNSENKTADGAVSSVPNESIGSQSTADGAYTYIVLQDISSAPNEEQPIVNIIESNEPERYQITTEYVYENASQNTSIALGEQVTVNDVQWDESERPESITDDLYENVIENISNAPGEQPTDSSLQSYESERFQPTSERDEESAAQFLETVDSYMNYLTGSNNVMHTFQPMQPADSTVTFQGFDFLSDSPFTMKLKSEQLLDMTNFTVQSVPTTSRE